MPDIDTPPTDASPSPPKFRNPYLGLDLSQLSRLQTDISLTDKAFLKGVRISDGTYVTTINILLVKLIAKLKQNGITDFTHADEFEQFVACCDIVDGRTATPVNEPSIQPSGTNATTDRGGLLNSTVTGIVPTSLATDDGRRTPPTRPDSPQPTHQPPSVPPSVEVGGRVVGRGETGKRTLERKGKGVKGKDKKGS